MPCTLTEIGPTALAAWARTWNNRRHWTGEGGWPWDRLARLYCPKPRSFHLALWSRTQLCGLAAGKVSPGHRILTLHWLESAPIVAHPLRGRVTYLALTAAEFYARAVGARAVRLKNPLPGVQSRYRTFGYTLAYNEHGSLYLAKQLTP